jgi:hypothetical protein
MWLWVDFNAVDGDTIWTSVRQTPSANEDELKEGQRIELRDHEGNRCWGTVTGIKGPIVFLELDWSTWTTAEDEEEEVPSFTTKNPQTGSFGFSFEFTERFQNQRPSLDNEKRTGELLRQ